MFSDVFVNSCFLLVESLEHNPYCCHLSKVMNMINFCYFSVKKAPGIRLSVEYSEKTEILKIRVWSLQFITLSAKLAR